MIQVQGWFHLSTPGAARVSGTPTHLAEIHISSGPLSPPLAVSGASDLRALRKRNERTGLAMAGVATRKGKAAFVYEEKVVHTRLQRGHRSVTLLGVTQINQPI